MGKWIVYAGLLLAVVIVLLTAPGLAYSSGVWPGRTTRIDSLDKGCQLYRKEYGLHPGQNRMDKLVSNGSTYTGSQILACCMYLVDCSGDQPKGQPRGGFDTYKEEFLTSTAYAGYPLTLSDGWPRGQERAICYYVPRPDREGLDKFVEGDNRAYTDAAKGGQFRDFLQRLHQVSGGRVPDVLIVAPGRDRLYFTADDVTNWPNLPRESPLNVPWLAFALMVGGAGMVVVAVILFFRPRPPGTSNGCLLSLLGGGGLLLLVLGFFALADAMRT